MGEVRQTTLETTCDEGDVGNVLSSTSQGISLLGDLETDPRSLKSSNLLCANAHGPCLGQVLFLPIFSGIECGW